MSVEEALLRISQLEARLEDKEAQLEDKEAQIQRLKAQFEQLTTTSRKRKRAVSWENVIHALPEITIDKDELILNLEDCVPDATEFLQLSPKNQDMICERCGITSWAQKIIETCKNRMGVKLPFPSQMKWRDAREILSGPIPFRTSPPEEKAVVQEHTKKSLACFHSHFRKSSKMEAVLMVGIVLLQAVDKLEVRVELQPSLESHSSFTDFAFLLKNENIPVAFIEVKNFTTEISLEGETDQVAQVLREVQILADLSKKQEIPFILTNSINWSFALACRQPSGKVGIKSQFWMGYDNMERIIYSVRRIIQGEWPLNQVGC